MITDALTENRKKAGLTQKQVAEHIGISAQAVSKWENGQSEPDIQSLCMLADLYNVSLDELVGRATPTAATAASTQKPKRSFKKLSRKLILSITIAVILITVITVSTVLLIQHYTDPAYEAAVMTEKFHELTLGMTMDEVREIFGEPEETVSKYNEKGGDFNEALILLEYGYCDADFWYYRSNSYYKNEKAWEDVLTDDPSLDEDMQNYSVIRITFENGKLIEAFYNADIPFNIYADDYECREDKTVDTAEHLEGFKLGYTSKIKLSFTDGSLYLGYAKVGYAAFQYTAAHTELGKHPWGELTYSASQVK